MEVNLTLKIDAELQCDAQWSIYTEDRGFLPTHQVRGELKECLRAVRRSVDEQLERLESAAGR